MVTMSSHPLHVLLHQQVGLDSFAIDGEDAFVTEPWTDRPLRARTPAAP